jgi:arylsulfatase A-like enzyme
VTDPNPTARRLIRIGLAVCALASAAAEGSDPRTAARPNIVFILADDLGWHDVGFHQSEIRTPAIDELAASGAKLEHFYSMPLCSPTRASLMTGRYPMRQGLQRLVIFPWSQYGMPLEERTLPQALKERGYETAIVGKWHLGHCDRAYLPMARGFEHQYGLYNGAMDYFTHRIDGGLDWHRDQKAVAEKGYSTELIGDEAVRLIAAHDPKRPLFLYVPFNAPHSPMQAPEAYLKQYSSIADETRRRFAAMVACADAQIARIREALASNGMSDNTVIVFTSDNGGIEREGGSNEPLRGGKGTFYEGGMRVPCCVSWAGRVASGTTIAAPVAMVDWYPTLLRLAGASLEQPLAIDGIDAWPAITGAAVAEREILHNCLPESGAIRRGDWKLVVNGNEVGEDIRRFGPRRKHGADRGERPHAPVVELFDLAADPNERANLATAHPEIVADLSKRLDHFRSQAVPPRAVAEPEGYRSPAVWGGESEP